MIKLEVGDLYSIQDRNGIFRLRYVIKVHAYNDYICLMFPENRVGHTNPDLTDVVYTIYRKK